jgi:hypothetical protein
VAQRGACDLHRPVGGEHRDHRGHRVRARAHREGPRPGSARRDRQRRQRRDRDRSEPEHRPVGAGELDGDPRERQRRSGGDRPSREEHAAVATRLAFGDEAREVGEAKRGDQAGPERRHRERRRSSGQSLGRGGRQQPRAEQRSTQEQQPLHAVRPRPCGQDHGQRRQRAKAERQDAGHTHTEPEALLGVEHEEGRERRVPEDPHRLREQHLARARPPQHGSHSRARRPRPDGRRPLAQPQAPRHHGRRHHRQRRHPRRQGEGGRGRRLDEGAADRDGENGADERRDLLRTRRGRPPAVLEVLGDDRSMGGRQGVEPAVGDAGGERERDV